MTMLTEGKLTDSTQWVWHPALTESEGVIRNPAEGSVLRITPQLKELRLMDIVNPSVLTPPALSKLAFRRFLIPYGAAPHAARGLLRVAENSISITSRDVEPPWGLIGAPVWQHPEPDVYVHEVVPGLRRGLSRTLNVASNEKSWDWSQGARARSAPANLYDHGDLVFDTQRDTAESVAKRLKAAVQTVIAQGHRPIVIGGDHSIAYPVITAQAEQWQDLVVVHLDAHADRRPLGHDQATADCGNFVSWCRAESPDLPWLTVGVRGYDADFDPQEEIGCKNPVSYISAKELEDLTWLATIDWYCKDRPVHLSIDIDVLDPSYAPEVAYPALGGISPEVLHILIDRIVASGQVVGVDISEVCGPMTRRNQAAMHAVEVLTRITAPKETPL